jgi:hypothetical protein
MPQPQIVGLKYHCLGWLLDTECILHQNFSFIMLLYDGEMVKPQFVSEEKEWNRTIKNMF